LAGNQKLLSKLKGKPLAEQIDLIGIDAENPEGWFFPDTYQFVSGDSDVDILKRANQKMKSLLEIAWHGRQSGLPYKSAYEALIMASIVEKETGAPEEREQIAGVFVRRLEKKMRLQTDPTVIYGLGDSYEGNITRQHLRGPTPYNTYVISGLPPTPIANPGGAALYAALNPAEGDALYFVARGNGYHQFSKTLAEHQAAVREFQIKKRKKDYRSTPESNH